MDEETAPGWYVVAVASEARAAANRYRDQLSPWARDFLDFLAGCATDTEVAIASAVRAAAGSLAARHDSTKIAEADLESAFRAALRSETGLSVAPTQGTVKLGTWPRVGPVDVVAAGADGRVACELKWWGESAAGRYQTLWDITKLGSLLVEGTFQFGFLLSGAVESAWELDDKNTRLFGDDRHDVASLCTISTNWWTAPLHSNTRVPAVIETASTARASFERHGRTLELRAARIVACEGSWQVPARAKSAPSASGVK
jgi:hypothetical protein